MFTDPPWKLEAIARLLAGMFGCVFLGSLVLIALRYDPATAKFAPSVFFPLTGGATLAFLMLLVAVAQPWSLENIKVRAAVLLVGAYAGIALTGIAQRSSGVTGHEATVLGLIVGTLGFQGAAIPLIWLFVRQHGLGLREGFGLGNRPGHAVLLGVTVALGFIPVALGLQYATNMVAQFFHINLPIQSAVTIVNLADSWRDRIALGMVTIVLAPLAEEGLFRGIFYPAIRQLGFPNAALWATSLVFALIHFNVMIFLPLVALAIVLAKIYDKTQNLLACIACHATFNAFNFAMLLREVYSTQ